MMIDCKIEDKEKIERLEKITKYAFENLEIIILYPINALQIKCGEGNHILALIRKGRENKIIVRNKENYNLGYKLKNDYEKFFSELGKWEVELNPLDV